MSSKKRGLAGISTLEKPSEEDLNVEINFNILWLMLSFVLCCGEAITVTPKLLKKESGAATIIRKSVFS